MALICYQDGFVLVGSVAGQRYWSSMLNLDATITCGIWTPDDQQVYFGTTQGQIIVMDVHGAMVSQVQLGSDTGITAMAWSCEKFKMEEGEDTEPGVTNASKRSFVLAVSFQNGYIYLLKSFDDVSPCHIHTEMNGNLGFVMEWSNSRELLAVAGSEIAAESETTETPAMPVYNNLLKFYTESGNLLYTAKIPCTTTPVSALTWGHNDKRIFIATGTQVHIAWVSRRVASLQLFCRLQVQSSLTSEAMLPKLPLPGRIKALIGNLFAQTIRCCVPDLKYLREFVSRPPVCSTRLHCTMIRHDEDANQSSGTCYTLYLEFLGGLVPLLKGKRTSKIRPEFVIFDPQIDDSTITTSKSSSASSHSTSGTTGRSDSSESDIEEGCRSPRLSRKRKARTKKRQPSNSDRSPNQNSDSTENNEELAYLDTLPEHVKLVEVTSNIWGTKFKIHGLAKTLPANLGQVTYKTSLLHLQPRQMTLVITELRDDFPTGPDPNFNPNIFSEDEEEHNQTHFGSGGRKLVETAPPIAPMSPRPNRFPSRPRRQTPSSLASASNGRPPLPHLGPLARAESYEDDTDGPDGEPSRTVANPPRQGISYSSLVSQCSRPSSASSSQSRVAISPLYCEGSVPTLQSPKNAVAPSDIIFDRPPAGQTTLMSYSSNTDYVNNVVQVKNAIMSSDHSRTNNQSHVNPVPLNLNLNLERIEAKANNSSSRDSSHSTGSGSKHGTPKKQNLKYIDEETPSTSATPVVPEPSTSGTSNCSSNPSGAIMKRTPTVISMTPVVASGIPESITRSCSVGYLDNMEIVPSDAVLTMMRKETPYKRLVLVDKKRQKKYRRNFDDMKKAKLRQGCKSKSLDSCDILQDSPNLNRDLINLFRQMPKVNELSENETEYSSSDQTDRMRPNAPTGSSSAASTKRRPSMKFPGVTGPILPISKTPILNRKEKPKSCSICKTISPTVNSTETVCVKCRKNGGTSNGVDKENNSIEDHQNHIYVDIISAKPPQAPPKAKRSILEQYISSVYSNNGELVLKDTSSGTSGTKTTNDKKNNNSNGDTNGSCSTPKSKIRKNFEIVTSFTDSPLFSRRHRSLNRTDSSKLQSESSTPVMARKSETSKSENGESRKSRRKDESPRRHRRNDSCPGPSIENNNGEGPSLQPVEITPVEQKASVSLHTQALTTLENIISRLRDLDEGRLTPPSSPSNSRLPRSSPASPAPSKKSKRHQSASPIRHILNSPLLNRRQRKKQHTESSDDENQLLTQTDDSSGGSGSNNNKQYRDLETFQKAQLRQKLKRGKIEPNGITSSFQPQAPVRREFVMHNKAPMWNENSQVYQLDFGGRVTQESAKNFQIEFRGKQVMQFGRIDGNAYTLDFQYPFSALQAFAVALANVTQRLK
ncbi:tubby-related protein 4-like isoform X1 [Aedes aegypti]|nr:tubby-related protein 4-like isoform X1 [Aedes aegypti]